MRRKSKLKASLIFALIIVVLLSIPIKQGSAFKGSFLEMMAPLWRGLHAAPTKSKDSKESALSSKIEKLNIEVRDLSLENRHLKAIVEEHEQGFVKINLDKKETPSGNAIGAKVIYRSPLFWSNFLIVDAGENRNDKNVSIAKGSPVIAQGSLVGVVDYVGGKMSRVKLISDEGLQPSVRVARGKPKEEELLSNLERVILGLESMEKTSDKELLQSLKQYYLILKNESDPSYLAKGVLHGQSQPLWRSANQELKGIGFNYDFSDDEGPARDLLTGKAQGMENETPSALIKAGDLLVTSGLDGVFPEGIPVAWVKSIDPLKEGDFYYSIRAIPCIDHLNNLTDVFILPSLSLHEESFIPLR